MAKDILQDELIKMLGMDLKRKRQVFVDLMYLC